MNFIIECMIISAKGLIGSVFLATIILIFLLIIGIINFFIEIIIQSVSKKKSKKKKPKYNGQPIIINGGKENEKK